MNIKDDEIQRRLEHFKTAAKAAGIKLTHQRLEIFREVAASGEHPDAEKVFRGVAPRLPTVSLDTVYRTLWTLHDLGLVRTLGARRGGVRFDANLGPHHHYVCVRCGSTRDFEHAGFDTLKVPEKLRTFGSLLGAQVEVRGICAACEGPGTKTKRKTKKRSAS